MPVTDPGVAALGHPERIAGLIGDEGIEVVLYERNRVEPTLGGGSAMDTAKVADSAGPTAPCPSATTGSELVAGTLKQQRCWSSPRRSPHRSISRRSCASPCTTGEAPGPRPEQPLGSARRAQARRRQVALDPAADDIDRIGLLVGGRARAPWRSRAIAEGRCGSTSRWRAGRRTPDAPGTASACRPWPARRPRRAGPAARRRAPG